MSEGILLLITKTINRQVLGLATTLAYFNHLRLLENPREKLFQITVGGLEYTGNLQNLVNCYYFEENYWYYFTQRNSDLNSPFAHKVTVSAGRRSLSPPPDVVDLGSTSESSSPATIWSDGAEETARRDTAVRLREVEDNPGRNGAVSSNGHLVQTIPRLNDSVVQPTEVNNGKNDIVVLPVSKPLESSHQAEPRAEPLTEPRTEPLTEPPTPDLKEVKHQGKVVDILDRGVIFIILLI